MNTEYLRVCWSQHHGQGQCLSLSKFVIEMRQKIPVFYLCVSTEPRELTLGLFAEPTGLTPSSSPLKYLTAAGDTEADNGSYGHNQVHR